MTKHYLDDIFGEFDETKWGDEAMLDEIKEANLKKNTNPWNMKLVQEIPKKEPEPKPKPKPKPKTKSKILKGTVVNVTGKRGQILSENVTYHFASITAKMTGIRAKDEVTFEIGRIKKNGDNTAKNIEIIKMT
jgi:hypothetical protein